MPGQHPHRVFISHTSELRRIPSGRSFVDAAEEAITQAGAAIIDMKRYLYLRPDAPNAAAVKRKIAEWGTPAY